jgi:DNA-binding transcriptional LysR family regulator
MNQTRDIHTNMNIVHDPPSAAPERLASIDLNLVVAFDALARERSVTRAAHRVGVTQSAMSHALRRLRDLLGDELLVRGRSGMVLTPRAESLVVPLRSGLVTLGRALTEPTGFEPASARRAFCIASPDLFDVLVVPPLLARIRNEAPGVDIRVITIDDDRLADQLETGEVDVAITPLIDRTENEPVQDDAPGLLRKKLLRDRFACLLRADHPVFGVRRRSALPALSLEAYAALSHVLVSPRGGGPGLVDEALQKHGLSRRIALRIPHFYAGLAIVAKSDLVLTAPAALGRLIPGDLPVVALHPPLRLPRHTVNLTWHERFTKDEGHAWLRRLVTEVARAAYAEDGAADEP